MKIRAALCALAIVAAGACATSGASAGAEGETAAAQQSGNPNIITEAELRAGDFQSAYDAIEQLRPQFFRGRSARGMGGTSIPAIYVGNNRAPDVQTLHSLSASGIREIRYLTDLQANQRFGPGHDNGAIVITLR